MLVYYNLHSCPVNIYVSNALQKLYINVAKFTQILYYKSGILKTYTTFITVYYNIEINTVNIYFLRTF